MTLFSEKVTIKAQWLAIMDHERKDRAITLSPYKTRCLQVNEIHEFMLCAENSDISLPINHIKYLGFAEIQNGGIVEVGDYVLNSENFQAKITGFDETHYPNHYNIVLSSPVFLNGKEYGFFVNDFFLISKELSSRNVL